MDAHADSNRRDAVPRQISRRLALAALAILAAGQVPERASAAGERPRGVANAATYATARAGGIEVVDVTGRARRVTPGPGDSEPALAPDGRRVAFVRRLPGPVDDFGRAPSALMLAAPGEGVRRAAAGPLPRPAHPRVRAPRWSLDGRFVYVLASAYAVSDLVVRVEVATGRQRAVIDANTLAVIRDGPWRGNLLVRRHKYFPHGGSFDPFDVVRPDGRVLFTVPGSDRDDGRDDHGKAWLKAHGWTAS